MRALSLAAAASYFSTALGAPTKDAEAANPGSLSRIVKRAEGIHLLNCDPNNGVGPTKSLVLYCPNDSACSIDNANNYHWMSENGYFHWEGVHGSATFPTGVTFTWDIAANARSSPAYSSVGTGYNGRNWVAYVDLNTKDHGPFPMGTYFCSRIYYFL